MFVVKCVFYGRKTFVKGLSHFHMNNVGEKCISYNELIDESADGHKSNGW